MREERKQKMDDKTIMSNVLGNIKNACDLMLHGTIESSDPKVHKAFDEALECVLKMQNDVYAKMSGKGWYPAQTADQTEIDKTRQKFVSA